LLHLLSTAPNETKAEVEIERELGWRMAPPRCAFDRNLTRVPASAHTPRLPSSSDPTRRDRLPTDWPGNFY